VQLDETRLDADLFRDLKYLGCAMSAYRRADNDGAAIVAAVLLKGRWPRTGEERPVFGYLAAGATAVVSAAILSVIFKSLLFMSFYDALLDLRSTYPYFALAFMAAAATSFLCDDYAATPADAPWFTRWLEGLAVAGVLAGTAYLVWQALPNTPIQPDRIPRLVTLLPTAALIGLIIGATVPTWYCTALSRRHANQPAAAPVREADCERADA
jgi:hypothetical protein